MSAGSIAVPGAIIMVNDTISEINQTKLVTQLHINEVISGAVFDVRFSADTSYPNNIRALRQRILVLRDHRDTTNRALMDVVIYVKHGMASISRNCFGPPGATYPLKNLYWGKLCIYHTDPDRTCLTNNTCSCLCSGCNPCSTDGYASFPYYPALYDPEFPEENHPYNQVSTDSGVF